MLSTCYAAGAFMVLEWLALMPFGAMRSNIQAGLGDKLADQHLSTVSLKLSIHLTTILSCSALTAAASALAMNCAVAAGAILACTSRRSPH
jgi:hypothetical protein